MCVLNHKDGMERENREEGANGLSQVPGDSLTLPMLEGRRFMAGDIWGASLHAQVIAEEDDLDVRTYRAQEPLLVLLIVLTSLSRNA